MGFRFNGFWDWWLWVSIGFMQLWRPTWVVARSYVVVLMGFVQWWRLVSCCELWLICGFAKLWLNEHAFFKREKCEYFYIIFILLYIILMCSMVK